MSKTKYVKEPPKSHKSIKRVLIISFLIVFFIFLVHFILTIPENPLFIFAYPELYLLIAISLAFAYFHLTSWKFSIYNAESDIYETIAYRKKSSIKSIAKIKHLDERMVEQIISRLIQQEKLFGTIRDGLFISERTMVPICSLCNKDISDKLILVLCPFCKRPFHKDHIIDYINEIEEKCPNCNHPLTLADIIT